MLETIAAHRSVRNYTDRPIPGEVMQDILIAATRASTTGTMQLYSIVVTTDPALKDQLSPCHFNQPMVRQAPAVVTFCADVNRFERWCRQRGADPAYDNFLWYLNAATDALLASENFSLAAEAHGLGICYLGTTLYTAADIIRILGLPRGVVPVTTVVAGYPAEPLPPLTGRLPLEAVVHYDRYHDYTSEDIDRLWSETENSELTARLLRENDLPNLARVFTDRRYTRKDNLAFSAAYLKVLREQGFFDSEDKE